jgi:hypothetical protein
MKEEQSKEELGNHFTIDEILGDTEWQSAQTIFLENSKANLKELKELIQEKVIKDAMSMINYRTNQQNDLNYISYFVTYALLSLHYQEIDRTKIPIINKVDYLGIHLVLTNPSLDPIEVVAPLNDDQVNEVFEAIFLEDE